MKVGVLSYPMLFQNDGGLQVQIRESIAHLRSIGMDVHLVDINTEKLSDFDLVHVFAVTQGNDKIVEQARAKGCAVVMSALLNRALIPKKGVRLESVKLLSKILGRISNYTVTTSYDTVRKGLENADHIVALSKWESAVLNSIYGIDLEKITIIPNAVSAHFNFEKVEVAGCSKVEQEKYVFCPAKISPWKNQKTLVESLVGTGVKTVLAGPVADEDREYLAKCLAVPGANVEYVGNLERTDPRLSILYSTASAVVLVSKSESGPLVSLEALASGSPAIVTKNNGLDIESDGVCLSVVDPYNKNEIREKILGVLANPPDSTDCRHLVEGCTWLSIAKNIQKVYENVLVSKKFQSSD